jgi:hypothetical protein
VSDEDSSKLLKFAYDGTFLGEFAPSHHHPSPKSMKELSLEGGKMLLAVCTSVKVWFFDTHENAVGSINYPPQTEKARPRDVVAWGEGEVLVAAEWDPEGDGTGRIYKECLPLEGSACEGEHVLSVEDGSAPLKLARYSADSFLLVGAMRLFECDASVVDGGEGVRMVEESCRDFAQDPAPEKGAWRPTAIVVDEQRELVLVSETTRFKIYAFDFLGSLIDEIDTPTTASAMAIKDGVYERERSALPRSPSANSVFVLAQVLAAVEAGAPLRHDHDQLHRRRHRAQRPLRRAHLRHLRRLVSAPPLSQLVRAKRAQKRASGSGAQATSFFCASAAGGSSG